jgi:hypothetical protein
MRFRILNLILTKQQSKHEETINLIKKGVLKKYQTGVLSQRF